MDSIRFDFVVRRCCFWKDNSMLNTQPNLQMAMAAKTLLCVLCVLCGSNLLCVLRFLRGLIFKTLISQPIRANSAVIRVNSQPAFLRASVSLCLRGEVLLWLRRAV